MSLSFFAIEAVLALQQHKSISKAAQSLYISEPALSKRLRKIEEELGFPLVERSSSGCILTEAGRILAAGGPDLLEKRAALFSEMQKAAHISRTPLPVLRLGAANCYVESILPKILSAFMTQYPDVKVALLENRTDLLETMCAEDEVDIILTQTEPGDPRLDYAPIMYEETVLYIPASYARLDGLQTAMAEGRIALGQLREYPYAELQGHLRFHSFVEPLFRESNFKPKTTFRSESWTTVLSLIQQGLCYTVIPKIFPVPSDKIRILRIQSSLPTTRTLALACKAHRKLPSEWKAFIALAQDLLLEQAPDASTDSGRSASDTDT